MESVNQFAKIGKLCS